MGKQVTPKVALYCRLSKDDNNANESLSIINQKKMLERYAQENDFKYYSFYVDDGYSGTNFERPDFQRMIEDIENGKVNTVITKDLSRLGRDYITTGQYTEMYFPVNNIRYIAINDGYDTLNTNNDIAPFKNIVNEMYARDTSRKIKSAFTTKMKDGDYIGNFAPFGYKKSEDNKNQLIIDEETAVIVKKIFDMAKDGMKPKEISNYLNENHIPTRAMYRCMKNPKLNIDNYSKLKQWTHSSVSKLLNNKVYLGMTLQGKTSKISFKSKKTITKSKDEWIVVSDTHEPIISQSTWDKVREHTLNRKSNSRNTFNNVFSGIAKCVDCGKNMSTAPTRKKGRVANLVCGTYKCYDKSRCSNHFIDYEDLYDNVLKELKKQVSLSSKDMKYLQSISKKENKQKEFQVKNDSSTITDMERRIKEIDVVLKNLYEDNISGKISNDRFTKFLETYENEQRELDGKLNVLKNTISETRETYITEKEIEERKKLIKKYAKITELNPQILTELIDRIEISQGYYDENKIKHQNIKIYYKFCANKEFVS